MARLTAALALMLFFCGSAWAGPPTDALSQIFSQAARILVDPDTEERPLERLLALRKLVSEGFDYPGAAELALGRRWHTATPAERQEFTRLFADLLDRSYISRMSRASVDGGMKVRYLDESVDGQAALVRTAVARRSGGEILLDYQMIERDGRWLVRDVIAGGLSVAANYRAQLERILESSSVPELLAQMRAKVDGVEPPAATAPTVEVATAEPAPVEVVTVEASPVDAAPAVRDARDISSEPSRVDSPTEASVILVATEDRAMPADPSPPPHTTKAYWLQMETVETAEEAGRLATRLREGKLPVEFEQTTTGGKPLLMVRVGPFRDAADAVFTLLDLQTKGHNPSLVAQRD
jgi:phospholipid transport system substrate-binding protein